MKRLLHSIWIGLLAGSVGLFVWLTPISSNFLHYLIWKIASNTSAEHGHIERQGARISYAVYGQGEPVLLLHGGLSNRLCWFSQLPWLVSAGRQVILIDTRGHGESTRGETALSYSIFADDTLAVLNKLGIQHTDIVGWSDGGIIALLLAMEHPERVGRIVAISANFHPSGLLADADMLRNPDERDAQNHIMDTVRGWFFSQGNEAHAALSTELQQLWKTAPQLVHTDLQSINAPTLVLAGENDVIDIAHSGDLAQHLASGKIEIILGAGHTALITHATEVNEQIASFLGVDSD